VHSCVHSRRCHQYCILILGAQRTLRHLRPVSFLVIWHWTVLPSPDALLGQVAQRASVAVLAYTTPRETLVLSSSSNEVGTVLVAFEIAAAYRTARRQQAVSSSTRRRCQITIRRARLTCELTLDTVTHPSVYVARATILAVDACHATPRSVAKPRGEFRTVGVRCALRSVVAFGESPWGPLSPALGALAGGSSGF
jgi:hypothetical protein